MGTVISTPQGVAARASNSTPRHQGGLELNWTDKDKTLLSTGDGKNDYTFVDPTDYRVSEVRLLHGGDRVEAPRQPTGGTTLAGHGQPPEQAEAASQAAEHLRTAYQAAAAEPLAVIPPARNPTARMAHHQQAAAVRRALPDQSLTETGWPTLAATLAQAGTVGHNSATLLTQAADGQDLGTATSVSEVLTWRLHRLADLNQRTTSRGPAPQSAPYRPVHTNQQRRTR